MSRPRKNLPPRREVKAAQDWDHLDGWDGVSRPVEPDHSTIQRDDWMWSRSVPNQLVNHEISDRNALWVLDNYEWTTNPHHGDAKEAFQALRAQQLEDLQTRERLPNDFPKNTGSWNGMAVLTDQLVLWMRAEFAAREGSNWKRIKDLAAEVGVSYYTANAAIKRQSWKHLP